MVLIINRNPGIEHINYLDTGIIFILMHSVPTPKINLKFEHSLY